MPAQIPINEVIRKTLKGIVKAQSEYEYMTGGEWVWRAPEYFITSNIAQSLARLDGGYYISIENGTKGAIEDAGGAGRGKISHKIRVSGRFDIVFWWGKGAPRAVIEVKNQIASVKKIAADLERASYLLKRNSTKSSFQFALIAYFTSCRDGKTGAKEKLEHRTSKIFQDAKDILGEEVAVQEHYSKIYTSGDSAWVAAVILLRRSKP